MTVTYPQHIGDCLSHKQEPLFLINLQQDHLQYKMMQKVWTAFASPAKLH